MAARFSKFLFEFARTRVGGALTRWAFAHATRLIPVERLHETHLVIAFRHPSPTHEVHILIVPKRSIKSLTRVTAADGEILVEVFSVAGKLVAEHGLEAMGYSLVVNGGPRQDVPQVHFHLEAGKELRAGSV